MLKWIWEREREQGGGHGGGWGAIPCTFAASGGHVEVLEWLVTQVGCPLVERTAAEAAKENRLDVRTNT